jgi:outer membrane protein assembly factor BamB
MQDFASTPAVYNGKVIIGPDDGNIYALDAITGTKLWSIDVGPYQPIYISTQFNTRASPIIYNGLIYVSSCFNNKTYCINMDGRVQWTFPTKTPVFGSVAIENNTIYFLESAGSTNIVSATEAYIGTGHKLSMDGTELLKFRIRCDFSAGTYDTPLPSWQTPVVVGDRMYIGVNNHYAMAFNTTTGNVLFYTEQPNILAERSHGSVTYVPDSLLVARNATNGTSYSNTGGKVFSNAGPTMSCFRADNGIQLWQAWGGWEIFSSPTFAGQRESALLYSGSESYGMTVWNATDGMPISWFTTEGGLASSAAIWDGKLYFGSQDNKVYCFEDHPTEQMAISMSLDKTSVNLNNTESVTVTAQLTHLTDPALRADDSWKRGSYAGSPPLPNASVLVTFTSPSGVDTNKTATTDVNGMATFTFTPNEKGTWKAIAWYTGEDRATYSYGYAFSDQVPIEAAQEITNPPPPGDNNQGGNIPMEFVYAAIIVIVIVIVAVAALMLLRKRKK